MRDVITCLNHGWFVDVLVSIVFLFIFRISNSLGFGGFLRWILVKNLIFLENLAMFVVDNILPELFLKLTIVFSNSLLFAEELYVSRTSIRRIIKAESFAPSYNLHKLNHWYEVYKIYTFRATIGFFY